MFPIRQIYANTLLAMLPCLHTVPVDMHGTDSYYFLHLPYRATPTVLFNTVNLYRNSSLME
jgi:hypothetical protein